MPDLADTLALARRFARIESSDNPLAWNRVPGAPSIAGRPEGYSRYRGLYQFGPDMEERYGITDWTDRGQQDRAFQRHVGWLRGALTRSLERAPEDWELYFAHQQGVAGAPAILRAAPDAPAWRAIRPYYGSDALAQQAITGNIPRGHALYGRDPDAIPAGDFAQMWRARFGRTAPPSQAGAPPVVPVTGASPSPSSTPSPPPAPSPFAPPGLGSLQLGDGVGVASPGGGRGTPVGSGPGRPGAGPRVGALSPSAGLDGLPGAPVDLAAPTAAEPSRDDLTPALHREQQDLSELVARLLRPGSGHPGGGQLAGLPVRMAGVSRAPFGMGPPRTFRDGGRVGGVAAVEAALRIAARKTDTDPSEAAKESGRYAKGTFSWHGLRIAIENPKGSTRSGVGRDGKRWSVKMPATYGFVRGTKGADGDAVDVYVGADHDATKVYVIDQKDAQTDEFDEHKAMLSYASKEAALADYVRGFSDGKGSDRIGGVKEMTVDEFKAWLKSPRKTAKPAASRKSYATGGTVMPYRNSSQAVAIALDIARRRGAAAGRRDGGSVMDLAPGVDGVWRARRADGGSVGRRVDMRGGGRVRRYADGGEAEPSVFHRLGWAAPSPGAPSSPVARMLDSVIDPDAPVPTEPVSLAPPPLTYDSPGYRPTSGIAMGPQSAQEERDLAEEARQADLVMNLTGVGPLRRAGLAAVEDRPLEAAGNASLAMLPYRPLLGLAGAAGTVGSALVGDLLLGPSQASGQTPQAKAPETGLLAPPSETKAPAQDALADLRTSRAAAVAARDRAIAERDAEARGGGGRRAGRGPRYDALSAEVTRYQAEVDRLDTAIELETYQRSPQGRADADRLAEAERVRRQMLAEVSLPYHQQFPRLQSMQAFLPLGAGALTALAMRLPPAIGQRLSSRTWNRAINVGDEPLARAMQARYPAGRGGLSDYASAYGVPMAIGAVEGAALTHTPEIYNSFLPGVNQERVAWEEYLRRLPSHRLYEPERARVREILAGMPPLNPWRATALDYFASPALLRRTGVGAVEGAAGALGGTTVARLPIPTAGRVGELTARTSALPKGPPGGPPPPSPPLPPPPPPPPPPPSPPPPLRPPEVRQLVPSRPLTRAELDLRRQHRGPLIGGDWVARTAPYERGVTRFVSPEGRNEAWFDSVGRWWRSIRGGPAEMMPRGYQPPLNYRRTASAADDPASRIG